MAFRTNKTPVLQEKTASGSVASFNTILQKPLVNGEFSIVAYQEGTGDPSPDNVRNIVGFSEVKVTRCGVNTWSEEWELGDIDITTGATIPSNNYIRSKDYEIIKPSTQYCLSLSSTSVFYYDASKAFISRVLTSYNNQVITTPSNARFFKVKRYGTTYENNISLNYPSTQTGYIAYTGNTYTIQLGQEVYGGVLDVVSGVLTVTHEIVDMGSLSWTEESSSTETHRIWRSNISPKKEGVTNILCTIYAISSQSAANLPEYTMRGAPSSQSIYVCDSSYSTANEFDTAVTGESIVYELAEPFDIQLTPTQIETLIGNNTIFADTGDVDLTYNDLDIAKRGSFREVFKLP